MWILMEVPEITQRHTHVRLKQIELALFTLCDGSFVFCDVAAEISAQVMVRRQITWPICRICPLVGIGLPVGSTLVMNPTYELQHYKQNNMCAQRRSDQPGHPPSLIRVFAVRTVGSWGPNVSSCGQRRLISLGGCPGWAESSLGGRRGHFSWFGGPYKSEPCSKKGPKLCLIAVRTWKIVCCTKNGSRSQNFEVVKNFNKM